MSDLLTYLIQNCLHDPKGDARIDISSKELEGKFEPSQIAYLKDQGLLETAPVPLSGLGSFIADKLRCAFRGNPTENGIEICLNQGFLYCLNKTYGGWVVQIENAQLSLVDLFYWRKGQLLINKKNLSETLAGVKEYKPPERKWTDVKLIDLLEEHAALKGRGEFAPTKILAKQHNLSESQIKRLLTQARKIGKN